MGRFAEVHRDAARDGFIDTRGCRERYGLCPSTLNRHLHAIGWVPRLPALWVPEDAELSHVVRCTMAVAFVGPPVLLTASSGLHPLDVIRDEPEDVHLLLPESRWRPPRDGMCLHYTADFDAVRSLPWSGTDLRVTGAARSLAEHSRHVSFTELCKTAADAIRLRHCGLPQIEAELDARATFPGRRQLRRVTGELTGELNHSGYERRARRLLRTRIPEVPSRPLPVIHRERRIAEVDIGFFDVRYGVEVDGPHHLLPHVAAADRARDRILQRDAGWTIDRFFWFELDEEPERFVREVAGRLARLRATRR
jgi:hypothetical protein